jgi:hypothetical protein
MNTIHCSHICYFFVVFFFFLFPLSLTPLSPTREDEVRRRDLTDPPKAPAPNEVVLDDLDVEAVYVPLPTDLHVCWAILVAQKKQRLLLEKPPFDRTSSGSWVWVCR